MDDLAELERYLDAEGRIKVWPSKRHRIKQRLALEYLALKFDPTVTYTEKEVNALLNQNHCFQDPALLRRELFEAGWLDRKRDGSAYWLTSGSSTAPIVPLARLVLCLGLRYGEKPSGDLTLVMARLKPSDRSIPCSSLCLNPLPPSNRSPRLPPLCPL